MKLSENGQFENAAIAGSGRAAPGPSDREEDDFSIGCGRRYLEESGTFIPAVYEHFRNGADSGGYRRARVALWHECKDVDLALWLEHLDSLDGLRRAKARALRTLWDEASIGIASHQVDVFILEPVTDRYLGRLCDFNACPKGKAECRVPGCGNVALLRQHEGFRWRPESLAEGRAVRLSERSTGLQRRASDLALLEVDAG